MNLDDIISIGDLFENRYKIQSILGEGANGRVFKAHDLEANRLIALKMIKHCSEEEFLYNSMLLKQEGLVGAGFGNTRVQGRRHPNFLEVYDYKKGDNYAYIAMEYFPAKTLHQFVFTQDFPKHFTTEKFMKFYYHLYQTLVALDTMHRNGFSHRDIKLGNILIDDQDRVKVIDLGLINWEKENGDYISLNNNGAGAKCGTLNVMSPEMLFRDKVGSRYKISHAADIFSFGRMIYHALTYSVELPEYIQNQLFFDPVPLHKLCDVPSQLSDFVHKCMKAEPQERYQNAGEAITAWKELFPYIQTASSRYTYQMFEARIKRKDELVQTNAPMYCADVLNDTVALGLSDGSIQLTNPDRELQLHSKTVKGVKLFGKYLATASSDGLCLVWDLHKKEVKKKLKTSRKFQCLDVNNERVATGDKNGKISLFSVRGNSLDSYQSHIDTIRDLEFSPNGEKIASISEDKTLIIYDLPTKSICQKFKKGIHGYKLAWSADGNYLICGYDYELVKYDIRNGTQQQAYCGRIRSLAITPDQKYIISGDKKGHVALWAFDTLEKKYVTKINRDESIAIYELLCLDNNKFVTASLDQRVRQWRINESI